MTVTGDRVSSSWHVYTFIVSSTKHTLAVILRYQVVSFVGLWELTVACGRAFGRNEGNPFWGPFWCKLRGHYDMRLSFKGSTYESRLRLATHNVTEQNSKGSSTLLITRDFH
jgi:hypothetical protein